MKFYTMVDQIVVLESYMAMSCTCFLALLAKNHSLEDNSLSDEIPKELVDLNTQTEKMPKKIMMDKEVIHATSRRKVEIPQPFENFIEISVRN